MATEEAVALLLSEVWKLRDGQEAMRSAQEEASQKLARSSGRRDPYTFRRKGNENQFHFNQDVEDAFAEVSAGLQKVNADNLGERGKPGLQKAMGAAEEGMSLIARRQKLLKLADRSEWGWAVVEEYVEDDLADDSGDEKRMERAELAAGRKIARKRKAEGLGRGRRYGRSDGRALQNLQPVGGGQLQQPLAPPAVRQRLTGAGVSTFSCFTCGEPGHMRRECPKRSTATTVYPPNLGKLSLCSEKGILATCTSTCIGANKGASGEFIACQGVEDSCEIVNGEDEMHAELDWDAVSGAHGEFHMPRISGNTVKGSLRECVKFWREELCAPPWVLHVDTVMNGYVLPLLMEPTVYTRPNQQSALDEAEFVDTAVSELLGGGYIEKVVYTPRVCSPLSVVCNGVGKKRLVVNLRHVNQCLWKQKFKYEDLRVALMLFNPGEWMFTFDLKAGYHHIEIVPHHHTFLGFAWRSDHYVFTVLPFGLSSTPYAFTKIMRPLVRWWRSKGIGIVVYLDDGICAVESEQQALKTSGLVQDSLRQAGFVAKSFWSPSQKVQWLGFNVDLLVGCITVPDKKIIALQNMLQSLVGKNCIKAKQLASLVGKIISMNLALGPVARLMTRGLYALLQTRFAWCDGLQPTPEAEVELTFWAESLVSYNAQPIWRSPGAVRVVFSDASDVGYGGYTVEHGMHTAHGNWLPEEAQQSSTWRELVAVHRVLEAIASRLKKLQGTLVY